MKHNGTASGISYSGSYIGSFVFPPIVVWLLNTYGLQGTLLVISGGILNVLVAAFLLRQTKTKRKYSLSSNKNSVKRDFSETGKDGKPVESAEMWITPYNVRNETEKYDLMRNVYSGCPQCLHHNTFQGPCENNNVLELNGIHIVDICTNHRLLLTKLSKTCEFERTYSNGEEENGHQKQNSPFRVAEATNFRDLFHTIKCSTIRRAWCTGTAAKQMPKMCSSKLKCSRHLLANKLLAKGKCKAKYKLKLQKLKKVILTSLLKVKAPSEVAQAENVKLTSFNYLHSFLCPNSYSLAMPNQCYNLTLSQKFRPNAMVQSICSDCNATPKRWTEELPCSHESKNTRSLLPIIDGLLQYNTSTALSSAGIPAKDKMLRQCDVPNLPSDACPDGALDGKSSFHGRHLKTGKVAKRCCSDFFYMMRKPMFSVISFTMSIHTFIVVCVVTTIDDYAKDLGIPENRTYYSLMALSVSNLIGTLSLGSITDRGLISK